MTADTVGGVWSYALTLSRGLATRNIRVTLATLGPAASAAQRASATCIPDLHLLETDAALDWVAEDVDAVTASARTIAALVRGSGADLLHLNSPVLAAGADFGIPVLGACHSCVATWWDAVRGGALPDSFAWRTRLLAEGLAACDMTVAPSAAFAGATARRYGILPDIVHNAASGVRANDTALREPCILTAGRLWDDAKNFATLDDAAAMLHVPVFAAGPLGFGHGDDTVCRHAHWLGDLTHSALQERMRAAPVFASLALYEPFGLAVLEAARHGCALVLSDIETFRELWHGAAIFVDPRNAKAAADALRDLLAHPARLRAAQDAARARAARFGVFAMTDAMHALYRRLLPAHEAAA